MNICFDDSERIASSEMGQPWLPIRRGVNQKLGQMKKHV